MSARHLASTLVFVLAAASACHRGLPAPSNKTLVILISIDTLRSDHLPAYGYEGVETPSLDRFRRDSILFERAYAHVPLTLPSHTAILTGQLPADNGVRDNLGYRLAAGIPTLGELLHRNGYATGAAVSAYVLRRETGLARGFDFYDDQIDAANSAENVGRVQRRGDETEQVAEGWIAKNETRPFFFMLHLYEPHTPYDPPEPFRSRFRSPYDGEIATADAIVGRFLEFLKRERLYDRALIVILSDHGEGLGEHGEDEHGIFLYREALQVPLLVKLPGNARAGASIASPVGLIDLFPTIVAMTGSQPAKSAGRSLINMLTTSPAQRSVYSESYYARLHFGWSELHSLISGRRQYIEAPHPELYDLGIDTGERTNLVDRDRRTSAALRAELRPMIRASAGPSTVSAEESAKLAALGYVGSVVTPADSATLPDPKERIGTVRRIHEAFALYDRGEYAQALPILQSLLAENAGMLDVWDMLSRTLDRLGRTDEAIGAAKRGLQLSPNTTHLALMIARMSLDAGRLDDAERHAELAMTTEPGAAHEELARIALARGDFDRAEREARLALTTRDRPLALLALARIDLKRGRFAEALQSCEKAEEALAQKKGTELQGLNFVRGDALARLGRNDEAAAALRKEIALFPRDPQAYQNLILLDATEGKNDEATQLVFELIRQAPTPPSYAAVATTLRTVGDVNGARYWTGKGLAQFPGDPALRRLAAEIR